MVPEISGSVSESVGFGFYNTEEEEEEVYKLMIDVELPSTTRLCLYTRLMNPVV